MSATVTTLLQHYKLTEAVVSQQVSDVHLEEISSSYCRHWRKLPVHLGLPRIMAGDIDRKQVEESEKRSDFLFGWKDKKGSDATYRSLISALLKIDSRQDAESVCKLLQESIVPQASPDQPASTSGCDLQTYLSSLPDAASSCLDKLLDWDNNYDRDLITIAQHLLEWEELLAKPFQLTPTQISDIKSKNTDKPALQRREVLKAWKSNSFLQATYRNLLKRLVDAKHTDGAKAVCDVLTSMGTP